MRARALNLGPGAPRLAAPRETPRDFRAFSPPQAMSFNPLNPVIVQSDKTILLETHSERFEEARDALSGFAELIKSPEHIHTYRITPLSLWNAAALGWDPDEVKDTLGDLSKYPMPD